MYITLSFNRRRKQLQYPITENQYPDLPKVDDRQFVNVLTTKRRVPLEWSLVLSRTYDLCCLIQVKPISEDSSVVSFRTEVKDTVDSPGNHS